MRIPGQREWCRLDHCIDQLPTRRPRQPRLLPFLVVVVLLAIGFPSVFLSAAVSKPVARSRDLLQRMGKAHVGADPSAVSVSPFNPMLLEAFQREWIAFLNASINEKQSQQQQISLSANNFLKAREAASSSKLIMLLGLAVHPRAFSFKATALAWASPVVTLATRVIALHNGIMSFEHEGGNPMNYVDSLTANGATPEDALAQSVDMANSLLDQLGAKLSKLPSPLGEAIEVLVAANWEWRRLLWSSAKPLGLKRPSTPGDGFVQGLSLERLKSADRLLSLYLRRDELEEFRLRELVAGSTSYLDAASPGFEVLALLVGFLFRFSGALAVSFSNDNWEAVRQAVERLALIATGAVPDGRLESRFGEDIASALFARLRNPWERTDNLLETTSVDQVSSLASA